MVILGIMIGFYHINILITTYIKKKQAILQVLIIIFVVNSH